jgi:hypothetical membrane protein
MSTAMQPAASPSLSSSNSAASQFVLHADTLAADVDAVEPWTMRFRSAAAERDYLRFRSSRGREVTILVTFGIVAVLNAWEGTYQTEIGSGVAWIFWTRLSLALLAILGIIGSVSCVRRDTVAASATVARRLEVLSAAAFLVICLFSAGTAYYEFRAWCNFAFCYRSASAYGYTYMAFTAVLIAPRATITVVMLLATATTTLVAMLAEQYYPDPVDNAIAFALYGGFFAAFTLYAVGNERTERAYFASIVRRVQANRAIEASTEAVTAILSSALPQELLASAARRMQRGAVIAQRSSAATVGIADLHSFDQWSTGHLVPAVISILHALLTNFDIGVTYFEGVVDSVPVPRVCTPYVAHSAHSAHSAHWAHWAHSL